MAGLSEGTRSGVWYPYVRNHMKKKNRKKVGDTVCH